MGRKQTSHIVLQMCMSGGSESYSVGFQTYLRRVLAQNPARALTLFLIILLPGFRVVLRLLTLLTCRVKRKKHVRAFKHQIEPQNINNDPTLLICTTPQVKHSSFNSTKHTLNNSKTFIAHGRLCHQCG